MHMWSLIVQVWLVYNKKMSFITTYLKDIIALTIQNHDTLIEMVMLHCRSRVKNCERTLSLRLKRVICASMVQIVA